MFSSLVPLSQKNLGLISAQAKRSVFWEMEAANAQAVESSGQAAFEKEAWLSTTLLDYGCCGFTVHVPPKSLASIFYCPPYLAPGAEVLPTAPVSADAHLITSLFINPGFQGLGIETLLIDAAVLSITDKNAPAVEAFGIREEAIEDNPYPAAGFIEVEYLVASGFEVVAEDPMFPRLRLELPPPQAPMSAVEIEQLLAALRC